MNKLDAFILFTEPEQARITINELRQSESVGTIWLLTPEGSKEKIKGCKYIHIDSLYSSETIRAIAKNTKNNYTLIYLKPYALKLGYFALKE